MALRSLSRASSATSGPGRGPASDGRASSRHDRGRARRRRASTEAVRLRAQKLFVDLDGQPPPPPPPASPSVPPLVPPALDVAGADVELLPRAPEKARERERAVDEEAATGSGSRSGSGVPVDVAPSRRERWGLAVRERLPVWLQSRCGLERRGVIALVVVLVVAGLFAAQHFWTGRTQPVRPPDVVHEAGAAVDRGADPAPSPGPPVGAGRAKGGGGGGREGSPGATGAIVVDVSGEVRSPGVHRLPAGSRVADALRAAGGPEPGIDLGGLNRARFLVDGEQVVVGGPAPASGAGGPGGPGGADAGAVGVGTAGVGGAAGAGPIGLNTASAAQLEELPGVGPVLAQHIIDYRTEHGGFRTVEELREVNGIGDRRFADLQDLVRP
ncbi:ComEA family DNA-binding protein [Streptomyces formicae]|uniref:ComEA family DNA-binding protein n=1 Tax=Streptomyces formicae TaxID=1616117 RepID=UPI000BF2FF05|nr:ComEA family DNA-binding protein [Streptomyces formicae]